MENGEDQMKTEDETPILNTTRKTYLENSTTIQNSKIRGDMNLMQFYNFNDIYHKYCEKKIKEPLSNYISDIPANVDEPVSSRIGEHDRFSSTLVGVLNKNHIDKEIKEFSRDQLYAFRLHPKFNSSFNGDKYTDLLEFKHRVGNIKK